MPKIVRKNDKNNKGGAALKGDSTFIVNNQPAVRNGSPVSKHPKGTPHRSAKTAGGSKSFILSNIKANYVGNSDSCGHSRSGGSPDFFIGN